MAKAGTVTAVLAAVLLIAGLFLTVFAVEKDTPLTARETAPTEAAVYAIIGEWEGKVAVYFEGRDVPETVYDTVVRTFPEAEQAKLKKGIAVFSAKELAARLEDYAG